MVRSLACCEKWRVIFKNRKTPPEHVVTVKFSLTDYNFDKKFKLLSLVCSKPNRVLLSKNYPLLRDCVVAEINFDLIEVNSVHSAELDFLLTCDDEGKFSQE